MPARLEAILFDVDGTLAETEEGHRAAFNAAFRAQGLGWHWDPPLYGRLLHVTGGRERIRAYAAQPDVPSGPADEAAILALHQAKNRLYAEQARAGGLPFRPGIAAVLQAARAEGLRLGIATTTSPENVEILLAHQPDGDWRGHFEIVIAGDAVPHKKPAPDAYLAALSALGLPAEAAIAIEDSRPGLEAALAAGLATLITPSLYFAASDFTAAQAVLAPGQPLTMAAIRAAHAAANAG
ncbi:HAD-IA family hydrolase [Rhabdaerophilum sp. SD176]|uniref:HAD-IA family hydrolase n=1 Tax=Rhabdaerophilum sp. SD176 TaxID=2983548 RepID=UPI0024E00A9F|nr:HAD-IA family hydrolase [Rhabdaerophilum sp. SD176]